MDLSSIEPHVQGMYDYFDQKLGFNKPPTMHFDSDPSNQSNVLGKTAYYDPSSLEIHVFTDGRHPKDMLRSIAHELIHHQQNLEGRLDVGGYMGEGYYLKNEAMRELEQEAMLEGNSLLREYEDTIKSEERNKMSLKEWKNNELNKLLLKKFGILKEYKNPDDQQGRLPNETEEEFYKRIHGVKEEKKPDADGDGVPDWADKMPGKDDHAEDKKEEVIDEASQDPFDKSGQDDFRQWYALLQKYMAADIGTGRFDAKKEYKQAYEAYVAGYKVEEYREAWLASKGRLEEEKCAKCEGECKCKEMNEKQVGGNALQEMLKRLTKAKSITLKSSGKKIK